MTPSTDLNIPLFERAKALIPGGVNSPVRAFKAVGGTPRFVKRAQGAYFWDANDQRFIDYIGSWGPMILGHGHPAVLEAVQSAALRLRISSASSTSRSVGAPKLKPSSAAFCTASSTAGWPWPRIIGPQEPM